MLFLKARPHHATTVLKRVEAGLAGAIIGGTVVVGVAAGSASAATPETVPVTATADRLIAPTASKLHPGNTTFEVSTPEVEARWISVVRLLPGVALERFVRDMSVTMTTADPEERKRAVMAWNREATLLGGVSVTQDASQRFTQLLTPGRYYLLDLRWFMTEPDPIGRIHQIMVTGPWHNGAPKADRAIVHYTGSDGKARFSVPTRLASRSRLLVINTTRRHEEAILIPVGPHTTEKDFKKCFEDTASCFEPGGLLSAQPRGVTPIAGGTQVVASVNLAPGRYALISWVNSPESTHSIIDVA